MSTRTVIGGRMTRIVRLVAIAGGMLAGCSEPSFADRPAVHELDELHVADSE